MTSGIPPDLKPTFDGLHGDLAGLYMRWKMYRQLFGTTEGRVALLNDVAPSFFGMIQLVLLDDVLSGIARMTDKVKTCGNDNLVLKQLVEGLNPLTNGSLITHLETKLNIVEKICMPIREIRHKRLAHRDYQIAVAPQTNPLPGISREAVEKALSAISDFMNSFQLPFTGTPIEYSETILPLGDGESLINALRRVVEYRKLEREGKVPRLLTLSSDHGA